jgi:hypothetical protein
MELTISDFGRSGKGHSINGHCQASSCGFRWLELTQ